jgi:hypothetical protein
VDESIQTQQIQQAEPPIKVKKPKFGPRPRAPIKSERRYCSYCNTEPSVKRFSPGSDICITCERSDRAVAKFDLPKFDPSKYPYLKVNSQKST